LKNLIAKEEEMKFLSAIIMSLFLVITACGGGGGGASSDGAGTGGTTGGGGATIAQGGVLKLAWDPNTESDVSGYKIYYGTTSGSYENSVDVGNSTEYVLSGLSKGQTYFIAVTAYDGTSNESSFSNEVSGSAA
jgi:hypothetical protein